jgi:hypothetical protein
MQKLTLRRDMVSKPPQLYLYYLHQRLLHTTHRPHLRFPLYYVGYFSGYPTQSS